MRTIWRRSLYHILFDDLYLCIFFCVFFFYFSFISKISSTILLSSLDIFSYSRLIPFFTQFFHLNNVHRGRMGMNERDIELLSSPNEFRSVHFRFTKIYECNVIERCSLSSSMMCSLVWLLLLFSFFFGLPIKYCAIQIVSLHLSWEVPYTFLLFKREPTKNNNTCKERARGKKTHTQNIHKNVCFYTIVF